MSIPPLSSPFPEHVFARRRAAVFASLGEGVMILPAADPRFRSRDTEYPYRPDSELYYLTGATEPGTVAVLTGGEEPRFVLFARERDAEAELWAGPRLGPEAAGELFGADESHPLSELERRLPALLYGGDRLHVRLGRGGIVQRLVEEALARARAKGARTGSGPRGLMDPGEILDELRLVKDEHEIECLRRACSVTVEGHRAGLAAVAPEVGEWVVAAEVGAAFRRAGAGGEGFGTIAASGPNACVLHYVTNDRTIQDGDLVLLDAGAEVGLYSGDVTRTVPASGRFTVGQRSVYEVVEAAHAAALAAVTPGAPVSAVHDAAAAVIADGLRSLGVVEAGSEEEGAEEAWKPFFPHQTSHWLGIDVHDPGDYAAAGAPRVLRPGMVMTVEPGIYIRPDAQVPAGLRGVGVRIEDDVLVTEEGHENLTAALPTSADEVEGLVGGHR